VTLKKAQEHQQNAYHLFTITYPLMQDPKIFLVVVSNLLKSMNYLHNHLLQKNNDERPEGWTIVKNQIQDILNLHEKSPIEFPRGQHMIICKNNYELTKITRQDIREYLLIQENMLKKHI